MSAPELSGRMRKIMDDEKITAYNGNEPFIFISYSHGDYETIRPLLQTLAGEYRFWYDEGIKSGQEWVEVIGEKIYNCELFVVFLSEGALGSRYIGDEIHYAYKYAKKMMAVYLEPVSISRSVEFMLERFQYIEAYGRRNIETAAAQLMEGLPESAKIGSSPAGADPKAGEDDVSLASWDMEDRNVETARGSQDSSGTQTNALPEKPVLRSGSGNFADFFEEGEVIGRGGSGLVLSARSRKTGAQYAVKRQLFHREEKSDRMTRASVRNELQKMLLLNEKPYTPVVIDYFEGKDESNLVMSRINGLNLRDLCKYGTGAIDAQTVISLIYQMALILEDFHADGLVYGDVKPSNFIINKWGQLFIVDFGGTCSVDDRNYLKIYTPRYAAPEQTAGSASLPDYRFDVYSLGKVFEELLNRSRHPAAGDPFDHFGDAEPGLFSFCRRIYTKMTQLSPKNRYRTIGEAAAALETLIDWNTEQELRTFANTVESWEIRKTEEQDRQDMEEETVAGQGTRPPFAAPDHTEVLYAYGGSRPPFVAESERSRLL